MKYFNVRRYIETNGQLKDFGIVDIPERDLAETLSRNPAWKLETELKPNTLGTVTPVLNIESAPDPITPDGLECPICGKIYKNDTGLKIHKNVHYGNNDDRTI